ncbi:putative phage-related protein [Liberibacter phage FP2]|nr:putative phage-related protein [Liberibacter phage FP2]
MIQSFLAGGLLRFLLRFIPSSFERIVDVVSEYLTKKQSIEYDKWKLETAKIDSSLQLDLADIKYGIEELKADKPIKLARIKAQNIKSGVKWIDSFNTLVRPLTTLFWIIVYPMMVWWSVKEGIFDKSPLSILSPFEQEIIACILGFWFTDKIVQKRR